MLFTVTNEIEYGRSQEESDEELLKRYNAGNRGAFQQLFCRYEKPLISYLLSKCNDLELSRDVCQETFVKLIHSPPTLILGRKLKPWLFKVASNKLIDLVRKSAREEARHNASGSQTEKVESPTDGISTLEDTQFVRYLLTCLPDDIRAVVDLHVFAEMTFKEVSQSLNIPLGTALWRMQKAITLMRRMADEADYER